jgi:RHH-type proline utilization regulon transcriptional repressor/proline dehydrogenase/delta 1-pyrroline-5-carboxylate dehydrogenase
MTDTLNQNPADIQLLAASLSDQSIALVRRWLAEAADVPVDPSARQLAGVLKDPNGLAFTVGFVDGVVRPEDLKVAARKLREIAPMVPAFLPWYMRLAVRVGGAIAPLLPGIVVPISRRVLRRMVGHLIIDATDEKLGKSIAKLRKSDVGLNLNLLGEAVLGHNEAARRLEGTRTLLARDDVDYVSIKVSSTVAPHSPWAFDQAVTHIVEKLTPLYELAAAAAKPKFINLDMEEYKDLDLTIEVFTRILDQPQLRMLQGGIVLQTYLPDALSAMTRLQTWASKRRAGGGAGIKVRIVKGANLPMEQVDASLHGWPLATWSSKQESDTNYKRVIEYALRPENVDNVRIGVAGHNLFDIAFAWLLAQKRAVEKGIEFEMLLGMAQGQAEVVKREVGGLLLYTPVVHPDEFDVAIAYLIRRLEEGASQENFMSAVFELSDNEDLFAREQHRFLASLSALDSETPLPHRVQNRSKPEPEEVAQVFFNTPDTDPSVPGNRAWARGIIERIPGSRLGDQTISANTVTSSSELKAVIGRASSATKWRTLSGADRGAVLKKAALALERSRPDLIEVMASETGKTIDQGDPEVSEAIDFANFYGELAAELDDVDGATYSPIPITVVTPPWNFPVAIPAGSTLAALAAGSAVIIKPARQALRSGAVMVEALWEAGVPRDALQLIRLRESSLGSELISDPAVGQVILTGGYETAELFRSFRTDLPLFAETSGKNAIIVTPSADLDLAAKDVVNSAFGHAGQKCSAASLVILVGSVATSRRFRNQLVDGVRSLTVGLPSDPTSQMGPVIEAPKGKLLHALTSLEPGESWLIEPKQLEGDDKLWTPGLRAGVKRGSPFHLTEYFGPVLGVMTARTIGEAIEIQNDIEYGLTAGLHSLDARELEVWLDKIEAGNLYVNRGITGAIVRRQPFGGWKKSAVGTGTKAGGPNYLVGLGKWTRAVSHLSSPSQLHPRVAELLFAAGTSGLPTDDIDFLSRAVSNDALAWKSEFGAAKDVSELSAERDILRYRPVPVFVRLAEGAPVADLLRVVAAGIIASSPLTVSSAASLPGPISKALKQAGNPVAKEDDRSWLYSLGGMPSGRIRLIGGDPNLVALATGGRPDVAIHCRAVTESGRIELLPFLREQAVSITAHRFGTPNGLSTGLI